MIIAYACLLALLVQAVLPGARLRRLADVRLRHTWLVWLALAVQVLIISVLPHRDGASQAAHLASYALAGGFAVANRALPGALVVGAGGLLNLLAIAANGGTMPASPAALEASGWQAEPGHFANSAALSDPELRLLGDIFATPDWLPVDSVFSIGDVLIVVGFAWLAHRTTRGHAAAPVPPSSSAARCDSAPVGS